MRTHQKIWILLISLLIINICCSEASGKTIYLSVSGANTHDGLTLSTPLASISAALQKIGSNDTIKVSGLIDFSADSGLSLASKVGLVVDKTVTIEGSSNVTDGLDAKKLTRFFQLNAGSTLNLNNIRIVNGSYTSTQGGGAMYINGGSLVCNNVVFDGNSSATSTLDATGGVFKVDATGGLRFYNCKFTNNSGNLGGVLYVNDTKTANVSMRFESCAFVSNTVNGTASAGAVASLYFSDVATNNSLTFVNCTMTKNQVTSQTNGGILYFRKGHSSFTTNFVNCTMYDNSAAGSTNNSAGIKVLTAYSGKMNIYNTIVEGNITKQSKVYSDLVYAFAPTASTLNIKNSIIGRSGGVTTIPAECYSGNNYFNYMVDASIKLDMVNYFADFDDTKMIYALLPGSAGINFGDPQYLQALNITTDQEGNVRPFTNSACFAGAAEVLGKLGGDTPAETYKHFIMYGQSLSTGHQSWPVISTENIVGNYMLGDQIWVNYGNSNLTLFNPLIGTISNAFKNSSDIMNRSAGTIAECPLLGAVNHIQMKQPGEKILATSAGTSGMSIEQLSKESQTQTLYKDYLNALKYSAAIARTTNSSISCPAVFWMQGEWNYQGYGEGLTAGSKPTADKSAYKALLLTLKNNMQADAQNKYGQEQKPLFITYECGAQYIKGRTQAIGMAQIEASNENADIICAGSVYPMSDRGGHLDPNGYRWYGEMLGKVYYQTKVLGEKFRPLQPKEISRTESNNVLKVKFLVKHLPLVLDQLILPKMKDYGFEVYVNNSRQTISSVSITDDCVYLTTTGSLVGDVEVVYAGEDTGGSGNLRDSDPYTSFFKYIDLDKKNTDGTYVFPRDASETTLRPDYEPKNASGTVIYDQPYPLYNFSISFYYKLVAGQQTYVVPNIDSPTAVNNPTASKDLTFYQSGNSLIIGLNNSVMEPVTVKIFTSTGALVNSFSLMCGQGSVNKEYQLDSLKAGIYLATIQSSARAKTIKIIHD
ncbi:MAG: hypothetical protein Q8904_05190 [Bacteroidota bacterium]|nr:hypothetical protein [Bacteroidota bacterium]